MRWLRRSKSPIVLTDFRRVSDAIQVQRAKRERNPEGSRESADESWRAVRSYRPNQRLGGVLDRTREFVEDSKATPRTFGEDWVPPPPTIPTGQVEVVQIALTLFALAAGALAFAAFLLRVSPGDLTPMLWVFVLESALLTTISVVGWKGARRLSSVGLLFGILGLAAGCDFLYSL
jgi:hypothetical protein